MELSFYGAAQTVTGSQHIITLGSGKRILLDCGMFQGKGAKNEDRNSSFMFNPASINYLILSHAHIDHCGLIPRLVKQGFEGPIFCTPPTLQLCELLLADSAGLQDNEAKRAFGNEEAEPLYTMGDVNRCLRQFKTVPYNEVYAIDDEIELLFTDAGHILGSAVVNLSIKEDGHKRHITFTGDVGRYNNRILKAPEEFPQAEIIICESTYGNKLHDSLSDSEERLLKIVQHTCIEKKGNVLIPAFSIGRTQELIFSLNKLAEDGRFPEVDVFVDSPLSVYATDIMRNNAAYFSEPMKEYISFDPDPFGFTHLHFITDKDDSKMLREFNKPCVIISSSGMMEGGRIRHHLRNNIADAKNTILITGYCEPSTLGGKISSGAEEVYIFGEKFPVRAEVVHMNEFSAHGDYSDLLKLLIRQDKEKVNHIFLVHGEIGTMKSFKETLHEHGFKHVEIAEYRMSYKV